MIAPLFCLLRVNTEARFIERGGDKAGQASQRKLKEHAHNLDLSSLKPLSEKREVGWGVKKLDSQIPEAPKRGEATKPREQSEHLMSREEAARLGRSMRRGFRFH